MTTRTAEGTRTKEEHGELHPATARWLPIQRAAAGAIAAGFLAFQLVAMEFVPILAILMVPFVLSGLSTLKWPKGGAIATGVLALLLVLAFLPDVIHDMSRPASAFTFVITGVIVVAAIIAAIGGALMLTRRDWSTFSRVLPAAGVAAVAVLLAIGVAARITLESHALEPGDISVKADNVYFGPETVRADAGTIAIHVRNSDRTHHDFVIDELGVKLELPERSSRRVVFEAEPGSYEAYCSLPGHGRMKVNLVVQ